MSVEAPTDPEATVNETVGPIAAAIESGLLPGRVWVYSNYHCNLECAYCLTESAPRSTRRIIGPEQMVAIAEQAAALGFKEVGVTGGEPFLRRDLPDIIVAMSEHLPVTVLTNGTLFGGDRLDALDVLVDRPVRFQISLDSPDPEPNDAMRGPLNYAKVVDAVPRMVGRGHTVRIATTVDEGDMMPDDQVRLCALHRSWGITDDDHLVRPIITSGRAEDSGMGERFARDQLPPELTISDHGAFWSAFGPTVHKGRTDTHLLITRTTLPLEVPALALLGLVEGRPPGADASWSAEPFSR
ncbi:radical SAM protein [Candidatus Neomicrothrix sp.]|uniref:radical SAM protein n=2 Tax=Candidatus Neomicrothrix sp. TaxID=2719034 RepID=UPI001B7C08E2|nr:radical SAM protein [Candidatus Microthrix sp.]MBK7018486.1 radical SAM protein [Candidatus Microthrix sp.]MBP7406703.1 radical SAM protein [Candidatus Microthrix sp.]MBP7876369.1 radical SAM protein [Candidatus Microthrix sp.]